MFKSITIISVCVALVALLYAGKHGTLPVNSLARLGQTILFWEPPDTFRRTLKFTAKSEIYTVTNNYTFGCPHIEVETCFCHCNKGTVSREIHEQTDHRVCKILSVCFTPTKQIQMDECEGRIGYASCYIKLSTDRHQIYRTWETKHKIDFYHFVFNGRHLNNFVIKVPSSVPQFILRKTKLIRIDDTQKFQKQFLIKQRFRDEVYYMTQNLNSKFEYDLHRPGWFQFNNTDLFDMESEINLKLAFGNKICKDTSKWLLEGKGYTREDYSLNENWKTEWNQIDSQSISYLNNNSTIEIKNKSAEVNLTIMTTADCKSCIRFSAIISKTKTNLCLSISDLEPALIEREVEITIGHGTDTIDSFTKTVQQDKLHIELARNYDEPQWMCIKSLYRVDTTCHLVQIDTEQQSTTFQPTDNTELIPTHENYAENLELLTTTPSRVVQHPPPVECSRYCGGINQKNQKLLISLIIEAFGLIVAIIIIACLLYKYCQAKKRISKISNDILSEISNDVSSEISNDVSSTNIVEQKKESIGSSESPLLQKNTRHS